MKVLFIFNHSIDIFDAIELDRSEWKQGYRYVELKGDWFTVKYNLDKDWQYDKVILFFKQESPLQTKSLQASFPLMIVLVANIEYHSQDYTAFIQQYGLPETDKQLVRFVERNVIALQSDKMLKILIHIIKMAPTYDIMCLKRNNIITITLVGGSLASE